MGSTSLVKQHQISPGEMEAVNLPRSRYLWGSNEAPAVKGGEATECNEAPLTQHLLLPQNGEVAEIQPTASRLPKAA
jgi:hypothetical protein